MDFHSLPRKDLQTLCKKNKIPANLTNVAMADSLSALQLVEGLEEFLNGTLYSEATGIIGSPNGPKTACRTATRRQTTAVEEPDSSMQTLTRTRRTTRQGVAEEVVAVAEPETPAVQSSRQRKAAPVKSQVRPVQSAYSTRRSVRFLEKTLENLKLEEGSKNQSVAIDAVPEESMADFSAKSNGSSEKEVSSDTTMEVGAEKPESESMDSVDTSDEKMDVEDEAMIEKDMTSHELQTALNNNFEAHREIESEDRLAVEIPGEVPGQQETEESIENVTVEPSTELEQENVAKISESEESSGIEMPSTLANAGSEADSTTKVNSDSEASDLEAESEDSDEEEESEDSTESDESDSEASLIGANEENSEQKISEQFPRPTLPTPTKKDRPISTDILEDKPINGVVAKNALENASLRQLHKMLKDKLRTENAKKAQEESVRVALQTLPENL